jgi:hypothetical protein
VQAEPVGLTENSTAFRNWMFPGPELGRLLKELEKNIGQKMT